MRSAGMPIQALINYMALFKKGKETVSQRKDLLIEQRQNLWEKKEEIEKTIQRLDDKIKLYDEIQAGKRKDFTEEGI